MKKILAALLASLFLPYFAMAMIQPQEGGIKGHLLDYGTVTMSSQEQRYKIPGQPGRYSIKTNIEFTEKTNQIPLKKGAAFGIAWAISGLKEEAIEVTYSVEHPEMTLENGKKSTIVIEKIRLEVADGVASSADGYVFNHDYELLPGDWKISIKYQGIEISKTFRVR